MRTWEIDPADDSAVAAWHSIAAAVEHHWDPDLPPPPPEFYAAMLRHSHTSWPQRFFQAGAGQPVAQASLMWWHDTPENQHRIEVYVESPPDAPADEAAAAVRALVAHCAQVGQSLGRTLVGLEGIQGEVPVEVYAEMGAKLGDLDRRSVLDLDTLAPGHLDEWADTVHPEYEVVRWDDRCPDEWLDDYVTLMKTMNDAPRGEMDFEDIQPTGDKLREFERLHRARGHVKFTAAARHRATGELAAFTELIVAPERVALVDQEDTAVHRNHRGHGLGLVVKADNLRRLTTEWPAARRVQTWNSDSNEHMLRVNYAMGFRTTFIGGEYEIPVASVLS